MSRTLEQWLEPAPQSLTTQPQSLTTEPNAEPKTLMAEPKTLMAEPQSLCWICDLRNMPPSQSCLSCCWTDMLCFGKCCSACSGDYSISHNTLLGCGICGIRCTLNSLCPFKCECLHCRYHTHAFKWGGWVDYQEKYYKETGCGNGEIGHCWTRIKCNPCPVLLCCDKARWYKVIIIRGFRKV